jgi:hypothetical protein
MFTTILGGIALLAIVAAVLILTPAEPWPLDGETWYEQFALPSGRDALAEELMAMRLDVEAEAIAAARQPRRTRPVVATFGDAAPGSGHLGSANRTW